LGDHGDVLIHFAPGGYRSLAEAGRPFSSGIVADPGLDLVHAVLLRPLPLEAGLDAAAAHVQAAGRPVTALAGFELRIPEPLSRQGFEAFNQPYVRRMADMGLAADGALVTTRTNVAPTVPGVDEPSLHAFTYTVPGRGRGARPFRLSGATESTGGPPVDRLRSIVAELESRMAELGVGWEDATAIAVYGAEAAPGAMAGVLAAFGPAALLGVRWIPSRPPIADADFEIDALGVGTELIL
jgi:hypothetical protein